MVVEKVEYSCSLPHMDMVTLCASAGECDLGFSRVSIGEEAVAAEAEVAEIINNISEAV